MTDTIFALSTPPGRSAIAVFRLSGSQCLSIIQKMSPDFKILHRQAQFLKLYDQEDILDQALVLYFKAPFSFTGEESLELQLHGSPAIIKKMSAFLSSFPKTRIAEPGEFTRRAFYNDKLDLAEIDGLSFLLQAETEHQRKLALRQMSGEQGHLFTSWREKLIEILSLIEADIDFVDGEIPESNIKMFEQKLDILRQEIAGFLSTYKIGEKIRDGIIIAIIGEPNVGKSTLINKLAKRDMAIVSSIPGTTRDAIEVHLDIDGFPVTLVDTAGLCETADLIEQEGIKKSLFWKENADFIIHLQSFPKYELPSVQSSSVLYVLNKADLREGHQDMPEWIIPISLKHNQGIDHFLAALKSHITTHFSLSSSLILSHQRQYDLLQKSLQSMQQFDQLKSIELKAECLRHALIDLGRLTGKVDIEEILGKIFSSFCIGK
jgi:tRNA modification GTPase